MPYVVPRLPPYALDCFALNDAPRSSASQRGPLSSTAGMALIFVRPCAMVGARDRRGLKVRAVSPTSLASPQTGGRHIRALRRAGDWGGPGGTGRCGLPCVSAASNLSSSKWRRRSVRSGGATTTGCVCTRTDAIRALPGLPMPKAYGRYPSRDDVIDYLERYAARFDLKPQFGAKIQLGSAGRRAVARGDGRTGLHRAGRRGRNGLGRLPLLAVLARLRDLRRRSAALQRLPQSGAISRAAGSSLWASATRAEKLRSISRRPV